ncbi:hypothetical protein [Escherichia fergusonii]|uniref:hypothetical protein n=1 Tax=Escherichia fergusonii TaxID=564 RepID=UPI0011EA3A09|nr:hypothetical protein [Escherichia fergusonii]QMF35100.1 hypothetical protein HVY87_09740 [Escherichia fergusonii]QML19603.1 hypothetical protein HVX45_09965 [Escherichia fergusonii]
MKLYLPGENSMRKIEDICLGRMEYINAGDDIVFDIWSTYDGRSIYKIYCRKFSKVEIKNNCHENETFFGVYVALLTISNKDGEAKPFVIIESGDLFIKVECMNIVFDEV